MGPALTLRGCYDGFVVECDGLIVAKAPTFLKACEALHRLRAIRAFAREELTHLLDRKAA